MGVFDDGKMQSCKLVGESFEKTRSASSIEAHLTPCYRKISYYVFKEICAEKGKILKEQIKNQNFSALNDASIKYLNLSSMTCTTIACKTKISTIGDLIKLNISDLGRIRGIGEKCFAEIINSVHDMGLTFADEVSKEKTCVEETPKKLNNQPDPELLQRYHNLISEKVQLESKSKELDTQINALMEQLKLDDDEVQYGRTKK